jgi:hypothetical protein
LCLGSEEEGTFLVAELGLDGGWHDRTFTILNSLVFFGGL